MSLKMSIFAVMRKKNQIITLYFIISLVLIGFVLYSVRFFSSLDSFNFPNERDYVYVDRRPDVEQPFLHKYDSVTAKSLTRFVSDWREWSEQREKLASDSLVNAVCLQVLARYADYKSSLTKEVDTSMYHVLSWCIAIYRSEENYRHKSVLSGMRREWRSWVMIDTTYVVPVAFDNRPILYLTPQIEEKLNNFLLPWGYDSDGHYIERHYDRESVLERYCSVRPAGDIPGYNSFDTFPRITDMAFFKNGVIVAITLDPYNGVELFLPDCDIEEAYKVGEWIV